MPGVGIRSTFGSDTAFIMPDVLFFVLLFFLLWFNYRGFGECSKLFMNSFKLGGVSTERVRVVPYSNIIIMSR